MKLLDRLFAWVAHRRDDAVSNGLETPLLGAGLEAARAAVDRNREVAVEELRGMVPGLVGRLEGPRLYITPAEAKLLRAAFPAIRRELVEAPVPLSAIDVVIEEPA